MNKFVISLFLVLLVFASSVFAGGGSEMPSSETESSFSEGLDGEPVGPSAAALYQKALYLWDDQELAVELLERALEMEPENPIFSFQLAVTLKGLEQYEEARENVEYTLELDPGYGPAYMVLVDVLYALDDYELVDSVLDQGIYHEVQEASIYMKRAWHALEQKDFDFAEQLISEAKNFALPNELIDLNIQRAEMLISLGEGDEALGLLEDALVDRPEDSGIYVRLGNLVYETGDLARAVQILEDGIDQSWDPAWVAAELGNLYLQEGLAQEALNTLTAIENNDKENHFAQEILAKAYVELGNYNQALPIINDLVAVKDWKPELHYLRARIHWQQGDDSEALNDIRVALNLDNGYAKAYALKGMILLGQSLTELAANEFIKAGESYQRDYYTVILGYLGYSILGMEPSGKLEFPDREIQKAELDQISALFRRYPDFAETLGNLVPDFDFSLL
jgi:tetratricopeptide (TPR) repeat protein